MSVLKRTYCAKALLRLCAVLFIFGLSGTTAQAAFFWVSDGGTSSIKQYDAVTGAFVSDHPMPTLPGFFSPGNPTGIAFGPDGNLYVADNSSNAVLRFDPNGNFLSQFVAGCAGSPPCDAMDKAVLPEGIAFGPDGNLYVAAGGTGGQSYINRYNGTTGSFLDRFVPIGYGSVTFGGLLDPRGITFGPDGNLYVSNSGEISRYNGVTGVYSQFVAPGNPPSPLSGPQGLVFGPDGMLYVADATQSTIYRFDSTGAFVDAFVSNPNPLAQASGIAFGPDGNVYVTDNQARVARLDSATGSYLGDFVSVQSGGLTIPTYLTFSSTVPEPQTLGLMFAGLMTLALVRRLRA